MYFASDACRLEVAVRRRAARVDDALGNPLVIEVGDLLAEDEVLEQRRAPRADAERVLIVGDRHALVGRQRSSPPLAALVEFATRAADATVRAGSSRAATLSVRRLAMVGRLGNKSRTVEAASCT